MILAKRRRSRRKKGNNAWVVNLGIVILLAAVVYILLAGKVGAWISETLLAPPSATQTADGTLTPAPGASPITQLTGEMITKEVQTPLLTLYTLQLGAFSQPANAADAATESRATGAAGYVANHQSLYRVLGAAYATQADATTVKDHLKTTQNLDCGVFPLQSESLIIKITAEEECITAIENALATWLTLIEKTREIGLAFDKGTLDKAAATTQLTETTQQAKAAAETLTQIQALATGITLPGELAAELTKCAAQLEEVLLATDADFGWRLKYVCLSIADLYVQYINALGTPAT